jgi:hypothetical protein
MRPKVARSLVMSVISFYALFEFLTPAIATDFISDMVKNKERKFEVLHQDIRWFHAPVIR